MKIASVLKTLFYPAAIVNQVKDVGSTASIAAGSVTGAVRATVDSWSSSETDETRSFYEVVEAYGRTETELRRMAFNFSLVAAVGVIAIFWAVWSIGDVGLRPANFCFLSFALAIFLRYQHFYAQIEMRELFPARELFKRIYDGRCSILRVGLPAGWSLKK